MTRVFLKPAQRKEVVDLVLAGEAPVKVAAMYGCSDSTVYRLVSEAKTPAATVTPDHPAPKRKPIVDNRPQWTVRFEGEFTVRATTFEKAITEARKLGGKKITSVSRKES